MTDETFTPTQWDTAEDKLKYFNKFKRFIEADCKYDLFTKPFYQRLSMMFGHIAHYDKDGFYGTWFSNSWKRHDFIQHTIKIYICGDPAYTWSDVEKEIIRWLKDNPEITNRYAGASQNEREMVDIEDIKNILVRNCNEGFYTEVYNFMLHIKP